jgi:uncharacterized protein (TIGR02453 family)
MRFSGFSKDTLPFLESIRKNNNKEWFELHKREYEKLILEPSRAFVEEMGEHLMALEPTICYAPKINHSLFRIYRDTRRMGANKLPLKHRIGVIFWQGSGKRLQSSSFYLHFSPDELFVAVGVRWFEKPMLDAYRAYIQDDSNREELRVILDNIIQKGYNIINKGYVRYPKGFTKEMQHAELSLYKGMATYTQLDPHLIEDGERLIETLYLIYEDMLPLQQYMYKVSLTLKS